MSQAWSIPGLAFGQFVPVPDPELTRDYRTPSNGPVDAKSHRSTPEVHMELIPGLEASGPSRSINLVIMGLPEPI